MLGLLLFIFLSIFLLFLPELLNESHYKNGSLQVLSLEKIRSCSLSEMFFEVSSIIVTKFKDLTQSDFRVFFLWVLGLLSWVTGLHSWIFQINYFYLITTLLSVFFCLLSLYVKSLTIKTEFDTP
jgi:hypothetical protein